MEGGVNGKVDGGPLAVVGGPLAVGEKHACAVRGTQRNVYCWGSNDQGQLGVSGEPSDFRTPVQVTIDDVPLNQVQQLAVGYGFSCALRSDRRVLCWGARAEYQTGTRRMGLVHKPYPVVLAQGGSAPDYLPLENIVQIAAGSGYACALDATGALFCWGSNTETQLGICKDPAASNGALPVPLPDGQAARLLATTSATTCVLTVGERLYCWGNNAAGTSGTSPVVPDTSYPFEVTIPFPQEVPLDADAKPVKALVGADLHMVLLAQNGSLWTWGNNYLGQLGRATPPCANTFFVNCDPAPGNVALPSAQTASQVGAASGTLCAAVGANQQLWCADTGFVTRSEAEGSVPLEGVETIAGAATGKVSCVGTTQDEVYCHGAFRTAPDVELVISVFGQPVKWSFPE